MAVVYQHLFTGADDDLVTALTPAVGSNLLLSINGTDGARARVTANRARKNATGANLGGGLTQESFATPDYVVRGLWRYVGTGSSVTFRLYGRAANSTTCYRLTWFGGTLTLAVLNPSATTLGTYSMALSVSDERTVELVMVGDQISAKVDGTTVIGPVTNTVHTAAAQAGFSTEEYANGDAATVGFHLDTFEVDTIGGVPTATRRPTFLRAARRLLQRYLPSRVWTGAVKVESAPIPPGLEPLEGESIIDIVRLKRHRTYTKGGK